MLDHNEVKVLLWLTEGIEPNDMRVVKEMAIMDHDKSSTISLEEWIGYICSIDPVTGNLYFDYELKKMFDHYDENNSGTIEKLELKALLSDMTKKACDSIYPEKAQQINEILNVLCSKILKQMDDNKDLEISWDEFKAHFSIVPKDIQKLTALLGAK